MAAANINVSSTADRPLTLPPVEYFSDYNGKDTICRAEDGTLVSLKDPKCPQQIRDAMRRQGPAATSVDTSINSDMTTLTKPDPELQ